MKLKKMKIDKPAVIKYCRIIAAVWLLALWLSIDSGVVFKYAGFVLCAVIAGTDLRGSKSPPPVRYTVYCVCLALMLTVMMSFVLPASGRTVELTPTFVISAVILAPVFEELFFRGALVGTSRSFLVCIISSAIFGAFHGADFLQAFLMGIVLSYFYMSSGSIAVPIICHTANNLLAVVCMISDVRIPVAVVSVIVATVIYRRRNEEKIL